MVKKNYKKILIILLCFICFLIGTKSFRKDKPINDIKKMKINRMMILSIPDDADKYQLTLPASDGSISINMFVTKDELLDIKKAIEQKLK